MGSGSQQLIEKASNITNGAQLAVGLVSMLVYVAVTIVQSRFFPFLVFTEAQTMEVKFRPETYHTLQLVQGLFSVVSALLFLGRDSFCVSKQIYWNQRPAHQLCLDWRTGVQVSILFGGISSVACLAGLAMTIPKLQEVVGAECISYIVEEQQCSGSLPADLVKTESAFVLVNNGAITCAEKLINTWIPTLYAIWYGLSLCCSVAGTATAYSFFKADS